MWTWPFKLSITGAATAVAGVVVISSAIAVWIIEDQEKICDARWKGELSKQTEKLRLKAAAQQEEITRLSLKLAEAEAQANLAAEQASQRLDQQRSENALSTECDKCRVPNSWIWVLPKPGREEGRVDARPTSQSRRVPDAGSTKANLP